MLRRPVQSPKIDRSAFSGYRFPPDVILLAVRWYLRYGLSYRDVEELLAERGVVVDHVSVYRWGQRFTPFLVDAARSRRHGCGDRWFVDETYLKVGRRWIYLHRAVDQFGQVIDVPLTDKRHLPAARPPGGSSSRRCHARHVPSRSSPTGPASIRRSSTRCYPTPATTVTPTTGSNPITPGSKPGRPMRGLKRPRSAVAVAAGHALVQNIRRGHYELAVDVNEQCRVAAAFEELMIAV